MAVGATRRACTERDDAALDAIAEGLIVDAEVVEGQAVELPVGEQDFGIEWVAVVQVEDVNGDEGTVLGLDSPRAEEPAINQPLPLQ